MIRSGKKAIVTLLCSSVILILMIACTTKTIKYHTAHQQKELFLSEQYNHFNNGVLFTDVELGLNVLWKASFKNGKAYKENLGFFVPTGLLILPNKDNTIQSSRLMALPVYICDNKLFVEHQGFSLQVLGIIHTHPYALGVNKPTPVNDYPFSYLGIHNYIIGTQDLLDAYRDARGNETFVRLGGRNSYSKISGKNTLMEADMNLQMSVQPLH